MTAQLQNTVIVDAGRRRGDRRLEDDAGEVELFLGEAAEALFELVGAELCAERLGQLGVQDGVVAGDVGVVERQQAGLDQFSCTASLGNAGSAIADPAQSRALSKAIM